MILVGKVHKLVKLQELINSLEKRRQEAYALQQNSLLFFNNNPCLISNLGTPQKKTSGTGSENHKKMDPFYFNICIGGKRSKCMKTTWVCTDWFNAYKRAARCT
jgi:hypothetical protein